MKYRLLGAALLCGLFYALNAQTFDISYQGAQAKVTVKNADNTTWQAKGAHVKIKSLQTKAPLKLILHGSSDDGTLSVSCPAGVQVELDNVHLSSQEGAPLTFKKNTAVELVAKKGTENTLTVVACVDTAKNHSSVIFSKDNLTLSGKGQLTLLAKGDGCKGINAKADLTIRDLTLNVQTLGDNLGEDTTRVFPFGGGGPPPFEFNPDDIPDEMKQRCEEMRANFEVMDKEEFPDFPPFGEGGGMAPPFGKHNYIGTPKGIKAQGVITIESGDISVTTTHAGGEGIEGKRGIVVNGGKVFVDAVDDGMNSNGSIVFNGGNTTVISRTNDAVDANGQEVGAITIADGTVFAFSQTGPPEEGFDCDFASILVKGGTCFSIGAGMGDMPSVPTAETALQPTALLIGLNTKEGQRVEVCDSVTGKVLFAFDAPFDFERSSSLITCPQFQKGHIYDVRSSGRKHTLPLNDMFTIVGRDASQGRFGFGGFPPAGGFPPFGPRQRPTQE